MRRRDFVFGSAAAGYCAGALRAQGTGLSPKLGRIAVMTNDFSDQVAETWDRTKPASPKSLDMMDLPEAVADRLHLHCLEVISINLLSTEPGYINKFKERVDKAKSKVVDLVVELDGPRASYRGVVSACSPDPALRAKAVAETRQWIDIAAMLKSPSVMINQGTGELPADLAPSIEAVKGLAAYGKSKNVVLLFEPRGRATAEQLVSLMKATGTYANPDIGNFPNEEARESGLRLMYPLAPTVSHVKLSPRFDFKKAIAISKEMGFKGWYSVETDPPDAWGRSQKIIDALLENI